MLNNNNKHSWCVNAFHGMSGNNDGTTKLCCMYKADELNDPKLVLGEQSIDEHFNSRVFKLVREDLDAGVRNSRCNYCWHEEDAGRKSKRMRDNEKYSRRAEPYKDLAYLELNLGNTCNISCRTCNPYISSGWMKEAYDTGNTGGTYKEFAQMFKKFHQSYDEDSPFWEELKSRLPDIKQFDFYGGEPFMSKKMWELLKTAEDTGVAHDIELHYNTNGTHFPLEEMQAWRSFREINVSFSIDGIGDQFEYMRYPAKWAEVDANMEKFLQLGKEFGNIYFSWCVTLSASNIYNVPETLEYYYKKYAGQNVGMYLNLVHWPIHHNIGSLPIEIKKAVEQRLLSVPKEYTQAWEHIPGVVNFMNNGTSDLQEFDNFLKTTATSDKYRNQNFKETFKEYGAYFDTSCL
jgi:MoaA/NifB/PqqE/SkfB family radical SAM enzyme